MLLLSFSKMISNPIVILAIAFAMLGVAFSLLAKKIACSIRKTDKISPDDKILLTMKTIGLGLILVGFVFLIIWGAGGIA